MSGDPDHRNPHDALQVEDSDDEPEGPEEDGADYLAPYLPAITGTRDMTPSEAAAVYRKCVQVATASWVGPQ